MRGVVEVARLSVGSISRRMVLLLGVGAVLLGTFPLATPVQAAPVLFSRSECRGGYVHVITYDISDPDHWKEVEDQATVRRCDETTVEPPSGREPALLFTYSDGDGQGQLIIAEGVADPETGQTPIDVALTQRGQLFTGGGTKMLIHQDPPTVSDGVSLYQLDFEVMGTTGHRFHFEGTLQTGGILGRAIGSGEYVEEGGAQIGRWGIAPAARRIVCHVHAPLPWVGSCWRLGHDVGCAGLPEEIGCFLIQVGKNRGKYLCIH
jgi:hypothetical protein